MKQTLSPEELSERAFIEIISSCDKAIRESETAVDVHHPDADAVLESCRTPQEGRLAKSHLRASSKPQRKPAWMAHKTRRLAWHN